MTSDGPLSPDEATDARHQPFPTAVGETARLSNEFAFVDVAVVYFGNGERLAVTSPTRGTTAYLDPVVLEVLSDLAPSELRRLVAHDLDR